MDNQKRHGLGGVLQPYLLLPILPITPLRFDSPVEEDPIGYHCRRLRTIDPEIAVINPFGHMINLLICSLQLLDIRSVYMLWKIPNNVFTLIVSSFPFDRFFPLSPPFVVNVKCSEAIIFLEPFGFHALIVYEGSERHLLWAPRRLTLTVAPDTFPYGSDRQFFSIIFNSNKISCLFSQF